VPQELFTLEEVAERFRVSRRTLQEFLKDHPYYRILGRRKLFTEADIERLYEAMPCPSSSYRKRGSPNWYIRGTVRGITVDESSRVAEKSAAEAIRIQREAECLQASVFGRKATVSFLQAAVDYMEQGGERRFVGPLIDHFGTCALASIDQAVIEHAAKLLCPKAAPSTANRQIHTPISAILKHAADRGWCEYRRVKRPPQPKGRTRWLSPEEAERLIQASPPFTDTRGVPALHGMPRRRGRLP
jgi:excisionase family DNA binding protein